MNKLSKKEVKDLVNLVEEFSWLISKYKTTDFKNLKYSLLESTVDNSHTLSMNIDRYADKNLSKNYLIGVLPKFFQDKELFEKNNDLADFAACLGIHLRYPEKKSRYEIIGTIICVLSEMDELHLSKFVRAIDLLTKDERLLNDVKMMKRYSTTYDWNDLIRSLSF